MTARSIVTSFIYPENLLLNSYAHYFISETQVLTRTVIDKTRADTLKVGAKLIRTINWKHSIYQMWELPELIQL